MKRGYRFYLACCGMTVLCLWGICALLPSGGIPDFATVRGAAQPSDIFLLDRQGEPLHPLRVNMERRRLVWTPWEEISPVMTELLLAAEDRHFWAHGGVAWPSLLGAVWDRLFRGVRRGGSTITMQLAALLDPRLRPASNRRTWGEKWAQMRAAWGLERGWSKGQILEAYLNLVSFRGELQGILAASRSLFDKHPSGLTRAEALILVALLRAPNAPAADVARRACLLAQRTAPDVLCASLQQMADRLLLGAIPPIDLHTAWAPHAAQRLRNRQPSAVALHSIPSTLDGPLQRFATERLAQQLSQLQESVVQNGAVLVVDNASGAVRAYVGGGGNHPPTRYVDGVQAHRQAGSTLKPFLYQLALEERLLTAASLLEDAPVEMVTPRGSYQPQNYDHAFKGWVSVRTALASSINVPAIRTLLLTGLDPFVRRLRRLGFDRVTEEGAFYGYALALGSVEVSLWELVGAYRTLANGGLFAPLRLSPDDPVSESVRLLSEPAAFIVSDLLADPVARWSTFGTDNPLDTPFWSAVKTGTSKQMRDNWCVGFTRRYTVGVWVGNFSGEPMQHVSGISGAAPVWREVMDYLHRLEDHLPAFSQAPPVGVVRVETTFDPPVEPTRQEWFMAGTEMSVVRLNGGTTRQPRILYPTTGTILAMDPDIPPGQQRLFFQMEPFNPLVRWRLDGQWLASVEAGWSVAQGHHTLELMDAASQVVERVTFQVRGSRVSESGSANGQ